MKRKGLFKRTISLMLSVLLVLTLFSGNGAEVAWADEVISAGGMSEHANGYNGGAFYFTMSANESIPYNSDWSVRYTPVNAGTIQRIRGGETTDVTNTGAETLVKFGQTDWYIEAWATGGGLAQDGDIFVISGEFSGNGVKFIVDTTYIQYIDGGLSFFNKMPGEETEPELISLGTMSAHEKGYADGGAYFTLSANDKVPFDNDWSVRYTPVNANTIQRIRDGVTTDVTNTGAETLVKYSETEWHMEAWATGGTAEDGDIFVVEGEFAGHDVTFKIEKTYILYSGGTLRFSTVSPVAHQLGSMQADSEHLVPNEDGGFYFTLAENEDIPYADDWSVRYFPMNAGTIQRIRDGVTADVTNTGAQTLVKYNKTQWFVEGWATKASPSDEKGGLTVDGDIFVVEGKFNSAADGSGITFEIDKTYIYYKDGQLIFSTTMPEIPEEPVIIPAGSLSEHVNGYNGGAFYFTMPANADIPYNSDWSVRYMPVNSGSIQLIRDGVTTDVTNLEAETLVKYGETDWFVEAWAIGGGLTENGDILVIEGDFTGQGITFTIDKTYVMYFDGLLTFSSTMPEIPAESVVVNAGKMTAHANGYSGGGFYFAMDANADIPYSNDWATRYMPVNAGSIQLIRDGVTTDVTNLEAETIVKYGETDWFMEGWAIGGGLKNDGDILVVEGDFVGQGITLSIEKTYIMYYGGLLSFSSTMPEIPAEPVVVNAGKMASHSKGYLNGGFYFSMKENANIPYNSDWSVRYMPVNAGSIQLIRDGVTTDVTNLEAETIVKFGKNDWFMEGWAIGGGLTEDGDILVVEGDFVGQGITLTIKKTYIMYYNGLVTFSSTMPEVPKAPTTINAGKMSSHSKGYDEGGFYFTMKAHSKIPYDSDWTVRYTPVNAGTIRLIRKGKVKDVTNTAAETLVKYGKTDWHMESWAIGGGLTKNGDILVVEGDFVGQGVTFTVEKTYIMYYDGLLTFSSKKPKVPSKSPVIDAGEMTTHITKGYEKGGFYFSMKANAKIPYNGDWSVRYTPLEKGTILRIRNGVTTDVTNTGAETLVKYGAEDWFLEAWATDGGLVEDGDILVIEGKFAGNDVVFNVDKTYVRYSMGLLFFADDLSEVNKEIKPINAGSMTAHSVNGYNAGSFYFALPENEDIPYNSDWSVRYKPLNPGTILRVRDGETTDVTNTEAETLVKYGAVDWHLEGWATDGGLVQEGDVIIVEGQFVGSGVVLNIEKSYALYSGGRVSFYTEEEWNAREEEEEGEASVETDDEEETEDTSQPAPKYYTKTVLKPWVIPVFASVAGCIIAAGVILILVLKKKKNK